MSVIAEAPTGGRHRSPTIFGIKALATLGLLTVHVAMFSALLGTTDVDPPQPPSNVVGAFFASGMTAFIGVLFVLPAMFFYRPIAKAIIAGERCPSQRNRILQRLFRLLPAYYVLYIVVLLLLNPGIISEGWSALWPVLLLHIYVPTPFEANPMNGMEVTWSVPSVIQWYLVLLLIAWMVQTFARRGSTPATRARRLMLPVPILIAIGIAWMFIATGLDWDHRIIFWWPIGFAATVGVGMYLAVQLALAQVSPNDSPRLLRVAAARPHLFWLAAVALYVVNCVRPFSVIGMDDLYTVSGLFITYCIVSLFGLVAVLPLVAPGRRSSPRTDLILGNRIMAYTGRISYGIYLWHMPVMHFFLQRGNIVNGDTVPLTDFYGASGFWVLEIVTLAGAVILASVSYYLVERPVTKWADRRFPDLGYGSVSPDRVASRPKVTVPEARAMSLEQARSAVADAVADRDAIRSNLVDLERSLGRQPLVGAAVTGRTKKAVDVATTDMGAVWELFDVYSMTVDEAARTVATTEHPGPAELSKVAGLLTGPSIVLYANPAALADRHITDNGQTRLTPTVAVDRMNGLFRRTVELVTVAEAVFNEVTSRLDDIRADLARVRRYAYEGYAALPQSLVTVESDLGRLFDTLQTDPLSMWQRDRVDTTELDRLRQATTTIVTDSRRTMGHEDDAPVWRSSADVQSNTNARNADEPDDSRSQQPCQPTARRSIDPSFDGDNEGHGQYR